MYRICFLMLLVCLGKVANGETVIPGIAVQDYRLLYNQLGLDNTISYTAFENALSGYQRYAGEKKGLLALIDYTKPSTEKRFCVIDLEHRKILFASHVAHGKKSGENYAVSFSNQPGSNKSSLGFFLTGSTYYGKNGYSLLLDGLEKGVNDKARERAIVIHGATYSDPSVLSGQDRLGRSLGCPALPPAVSQKVIDTIKNGVLLYIYGQNKS